MKKYMRFGILLPKKDTGKCLEVPLLLCNETLAIVQLFDEIVLCDIVSDNEVLILKRKEILLDMRDYIEL